MLRVYYTTPNEKPAWIADFNSEEFAQVLVDAGNRLYEGEREFYFEDSAADEAMISDDDLEFVATDDKLELISDFERTESQAYNKELSTFAVRF